jgi:hypothetical protein
MKRAVSAIIAMICLFPGVSRAGSTADDWELRKSKDGILVFTRDIPGSGFKEFRAMTQVDASMTSILMLMEDIPSYPEWYTRLKEIKVLKIVSAREIILYQLLSVPFPADNRDSIFRVTVYRDQAGPSLTLRLESLPDYVPERKGVVRVKIISGSWTFTRTGTDGPYTVTYQMHSDPGGKLPAWIANAAVVKRPFTILKNMKKMLKKPRYRDAKESDLQHFR